MKLMGARLREFQDTMLPLNEASNLPSLCYTSPEWYEQEVAKIFCREWLCVGRVDQIPNAGDYFTTVVADEHIAVIRGEEGELNAVVPICRHRGALMLLGTGNCRTISCPYHGWTYKPSGELVSIGGHHRPMRDIRGFDYKENGLATLRVETWGGFIFVNFDPNAPALSGWLADIPNRFRNYNLETMICTHTHSYVVNCNWKIYAENAYDEYHVEFVHRPYLPPGNTYRIESPEAAGSHTLWYNPDYTAVAPGLPLIDGLNERQRGGVYQIQIRPNLYLIFSPSFAKFMTMVPISIGKTQLTMTWCFPPSTVRLEKFQELAEREFYPLTKAIVEQDNEISERTQLGIMARFRRRGRLTQRELQVHEFQKYVLEKVLSPSNPHDQSS